MEAMSPEHQEEESSPAWRAARDWGARIYDLGLHSSPSTQRTSPIYKIKAHMLKPSLSLVLSFTGYSFRKFFPTAATPAEGLLMLPADVPPASVRALLPASSANSSSPASLQSVRGGRGGAYSRAGVKAGETYPSFALSSLLPNPFL